MKYSSLVLKHLDSSLQLIKQTQKICNLSKMKINLFTNGQIVKFTNLTLSNQTFRQLLKT